MAADWIKMRAGLGSSIEVARIATATHTKVPDVTLALYRLSDWFHEQGTYGKLEIEPSLIDVFLKIDGFAAALLNNDWLKVHGAVVTLHGFCDVSAGRKSLGRALRARVLSTGRCAACESPDELVVDHKVPIARGGSCEESNLQALCAPCNRSKGRKTMEEWRR